MEVVRNTVVQLTEGNKAVAVVGIAALLELVVHAHRISVEIVLHRKCSIILAEYQTRVPSWLTEKMKSSLIGAF